MKIPPKTTPIDTRTQLNKAIEVLLRFGYNTRSELNAPLMLAEFIASSSNKEISDYGSTLQHALSNVANLLDQFEGEMKEILLGVPKIHSPFVPEVRSNIYQKPPNLNNSNTNIPHQKQITISTQDEHVLVVEDNPVSQALVKKILEKNGCKVEIAVSGEDALLAVNRSIFSVILMDISLPGIDGFETTKLLKENKHSENVPIIALSAHSNTEMKINASEAGMAGFISKPVDTNSLLRTIKSLKDKTRL